MQETDAERAALERFEALLVRCERVRPGGLAFAELRELGALYRRFAAQLARLREAGHDPEAARYLNALCVRAHTHLHPAPPVHGSRLAAAAGRLPRAVAATWRPQVLAWALLALGLALGAALGRQDPEALYALVPASLGYTPERLDRLVASPEARAEFLAPEATAVPANALFGTVLFAHNTRVGLLSFATGILAGVPTALLQVYNGLLVGALGQVFFHDPSPVPFLAWILPHGIPEFTAITLCAAGGLVLGAAVLLPGRRRRSEALREAIDPALLLVGASLPLFLAAAGIESFVRESALGVGPRLAVAGLMAALLAVGLLAVRRVARRSAVDTAWLYPDPELPSAAPQRATNSRSSR